MASWRDVATPAKLGTQLVADPAGRVFVGEFDRVGSEPPDADDSDDARRQDAADRAIRLDVFQRCHRSSAYPPPPFELERTKSPQRAKLP
jgi:hypothetical protein